MKKIIVSLFIVSISFLCAGEWDHNLETGVSVRKTDGAWFNIASKRFVDPRTDNPEFGVWHSFNLSCFLNLESTVGERIENLEFNFSTEIKLIRYAIYQTLGSHYFIDGEQVKSGSYKIYHCECYFGCTEVVWRRNGVEEIIWKSDLELTHKIGNPTGEIIAEPWDRNIYPLTGKSSDYTSGPRELLLASL
jgi:hypothetical protein